MCPPARFHPYVQPLHHHRPRPHPHPHLYLHLAGWTPLQQHYNAAAAGDLSRESVGAAYPRMPLKFSLHKQQLSCPEELKEFLLDTKKMPQGNGLRVVMIPRQRYGTMTSEQRLRLLDQALQARIFVIVQGAFDARREDQRGDPGGGA